MIMSIEISQTIVMSYALQTMPLKIIRSTQNMLIRTDLCTHESQETRMCLLSVCLLNFGDIVSKFEESQ